MKKTVLIILGIVLCIIIAIPTFYLIGLGISEYKMDQEKAQLEDQAIINVKAYIQEKYPDKNLEVVSAKADELYNGWVQSGWDDTVEVYVKDKSGKQYLFITNGELKDKEGVASCRDNVQEQEIKNAIVSVVKESANMSTKSTVITSDFEIDKTINEVVEFDRMYRGDMFYEKFNGDIVNFLNNHKNEDNEKVEVKVWIAYTDKSVDMSEIKNTEILDLLDFVALIEFTDNIPPSEHTYTHNSAEWIHDTLTRTNHKYSHIYTYNKTSKDFLEFVKNETVLV